MLHTFHMRGLSLREDRVPPRVTQPEGLGRIAAIDFPSWHGWPCLEGSAALPWSTAKSSSYFVSLPKSPFLGPGPWATKIRLCWWRSSWLGLSLDLTTPPTLNGPRQVSGREHSILSFVTFQTVVRTWKSI